MATTYTTPLPLLNLLPQPPKSLKPSHTTTPPRILTPPLLLRRPAVLLLPLTGAALLIDPQDALAVAGEFGILEGRSLALVHPLIMGTLFLYTLYAGYLGWQWRRVRTIQEEINDLKKQLPASSAAPDGPQPDPSPLELKIQQLTEGRKALVKGSFRDRHFNAGSTLLGLGALESVGGSLNTWLRTGKLFPGPHLFAGAGLRVPRKKFILQSRSFDGLGIPVAFTFVEKRSLIARASEGTDGGELDVTPPEGPEVAVPVENLPLESKLQLKLEQKLRMKLAKKIRLRRKRLVRKRRLRKKGRWPPSKMKKNKNV